MRKIVFWVIFSLGSLCNLALISLGIYGMLEFPLFASGAIFMFILVFICYWTYSMLSSRPKNSDCW